MQTVIFLGIRIITKQCPKNAQHYEMHPKYSYFSRAATVSRKGHKFVAFGLEIAQPFPNTHTTQKFQNMYEQGSIPEGPAMMSRRKFFGFGGVSGKMGEVKEKWIRVYLLILCTTNLAFC